MFPWKTTLELLPNAARLLVTDPWTGDRLKALLPARPDHPRALLTLLEGLALWNGQPLTTAICVAPQVGPSSVRDLLGSGNAPIDSALVRFIEVDPDRPRRVLHGLGDFRRVRRAGRCL